MNKLIKYLKTLIVIALICTKAQATILYVDSASTSNSLGGTTWATAYKNLEVAIAAAIGGDQIWVKKGSYTPPFNSSFALRSYISYYGGFAGTETNINQRTKLNRTFLQGNSNSVMNAGADLFNHTLDGFTIRGGAGTNGGGICSNFGMFNCNFKDLVLEHNYANNLGGGFCADYLYQTKFTNCVFTANTSGNPGGGIYFNNMKGLIFTNCIFWENALNGSNGIQIGWDIGYGGHDPNDNFQLINCLVGSPMTPVVLQILAPGATAGMTIRNTIILSMTVVEELSYYPILADNNYYGDGYPQGAVNIIFVAPQFVNINNPVGIDGIWGTNDDGLRPISTSSSVNNGNNVAITPGVTEDIQGYPRINQGTIDLGPYEYGETNIVTNQSVCDTNYAWNSTTYTTSGTYTHPYTNSYGYASTDTLHLTLNPVPYGSTSQTNLTCFGVNNGSATVNIGGGSGVYSYLWTPYGGTGPTATGLASTNYTCTITDANTCSITKIFSIATPLEITTTTTQTNINCNGASNAIATVNVNGGILPYSYSWLPSGGITDTITGLSAGTYTCTITDGHACTKTQTVTITQPNTITSSVSSQTNVSCSGTSTGSATIAANGGTGAYTYSWLPSSGTTATATGLSAGVYTCTITDANACTKTQTVTITQPSIITSSVSSQTNVNCNGASTGSATINASGGAGAYTYTWSPSGGTATTAASLSAGTYTCTITDTNACTKTQTVTITQPSIITSSVSSQTNVTCNGTSNGSATIAASGGAGAYTYSWLPNGGTAATATGLSAGTYTCTITDANACTKTQTVSISQPTALVTSVTASAILCHGANSMVTASASGGTTSYTGIGTFTVTAGTYTYTVSDANGCSNSATITITEPALITSTQNYTLCAGQSLTVGSNTYNTAGVYTDTLSAANGCDSVVTSHLFVNPAISSTQNISLCNGQSITVGSHTYANSGVFTDVLSAANGCDSTVITNLTVNSFISHSQSVTLCAGQSVTVGSNIYAASGTYTDVLTAAGGCDSVVTTNLTVIPAISISQNLNVCAGESVIVGSNSYNSSGVYTDVLTAVNGCDSTITTNLTILPTISSSQNINLCAGDSITIGDNTYHTSGIYTDVFMASNGCDSTLTTHLTVENAIDITTTVSSSTITANAVGATYQWIDCNNGYQAIQGATNQSFTATQSGTYAVIIAINSCSDTSNCVTMNVTGIKATNTQNSLSVYPNPSSGIFMIKGITVGSQIFIQNSIGELVYTAKVIKDSIEINISDLAEGVYFIRTSANQTFKLIKQ